jgi:hypothetical protein
MTANIEQPRAKTKQLRVGGLATPQIKFEERVLNGAFLKCAAALPNGRPAPRHAWDNRAREDGRVPHPCHDAILLLRGAMHAAIESGDHLVVRQTRLEIESYFDQCMNAAVDVGTVLTEEVSVADVINVECEAVSALALANETQSPGALDQAREKMWSAIDRAGNYLRMLDARRRTDARVSIR